MYNQSNGESTTIGFIKKNIYKYKNSATDNVDF